MKTYKIIVSYDGTDYSGWIQQRNQPSIVQTLQDTFARIFGHSIVLLGASRTDAGVHALGQVARFHTSLVMEQKQLMAWNNALPDSIVIHSLVEHDQFHPLHDVEQKIYQYHFSVNRPSPIVARYVHHVTYPLDMDKLVAALALFQGTHNFAAFYTGNDRPDTIRTIRSISLDYAPEYAAYRVTIIGATFLRHMVRRMVGAALAVAIRDHMQPALIQQALTTGAMHSDLPTAPAKGLMLYGIEYKKKDTL